MVTAQAHTMNKTIAIDFDHTWTADPSLWNLFHKFATERGHRIIMVTARQFGTISEAEAKRNSLPKAMPIIYTGGKLKEEHAMRLGYKVDIWIDDMPGMIQKCLVLETPNNDKDL